MPLYNRLIEKGKEEDENPGTALNKLKEVGSTAASLVGIDPESDTLVQDLGYEMLDMAAHQRNNPGLPGAISYVGAQAVQHIPFVRMGREYVSNQLDNWLSPIFKTNNLAAEGVGKLDNNLNVMQSKGITPSQPSFGQNFVPPNPTEIHKVSQKLLNEHLLANGGRFNYNAFRSLLESPKARSIAELVQTTPHSKIPNWDTHRKGLVDVFESIYGDTMALKGISRSDVDIDHLVTLVQSMPIYDNVKFGSPLWNEIQTVMLSRNYKPGRTLENLNALDPGTHKVKTAFFNNLHGKDCRVFFTKARMKAIQNNPDARIKLLDLYLDEIDKGTAILEEGQKVWETLYKPGTVLPEQLVKTLSKIKVNKYSHPDLINITREIVESESENLLKNISKAEQNLVNRINNPNQKTRVTKKNRLPTQKQIDQQIKEAGDSFQPTIEGLLDKLFD